MSDSLQPHGLQHTRLPCPSPSLRVCSKSCPPELVMPSNHLILCRPRLLPPLIFPSIRAFSDESALPIRWPKYWSFSFNISPSVHGSVISTLCNSMNRSTPGLPVHPQLPESTQTHVHCVSDAIQPSHPLSSPSPPALNLSHHNRIF